MERIGRVTYYLGLVVARPEIMHQSSLRESVEGVVEIGFF